MLILAGVSIAVLTGDNSILRRSSEAKVTTKIAEIEEQANLLYTSELITALKSPTGPVTITASAGGKSATCTVTVLKYVNVTITAEFAASAVNLGTEVTIGTQKFYVIKKFTEGTVDKVALLSKYK